MKESSLLSAKEFDTIEQEQGTESKLSSMSGVTQVRRGSSHLQRSKLEVSLPTSDDLIVEKKNPS